MLSKALGLQPWLATNPSIVQLSASYIVTKVPPGVIPEFRSLHAVIDYLMSTYRFGSIIKTKAELIKI